MNARQQKILELLREQQEVSVQELSAGFNVSAMTVRRDLEQLERERLATRTHGGAISARSAVVEFAFHERNQEQLAEKRALAKYMAAQVRPGTTLVLDTGTTTLEVARELARLPDLRVLTTSLAIASVLYAHEQISLTLLGGSVRQNSPDLVGPLTEENLRRFHPDLAVIGADAAGEDGVYTATLEVARITGAMLEQARETWLVADSRKFARRSFVKFADWDRLQHVVTDVGLSAEGAGVAAGERDHGASRRSVKGTYETGTSSRHYRRRVDGQGDMLRPRALVPHHGRVGRARGYGGVRHESGGAALVHGAHSERHVGDRGLS